MNKHMPLSLLLLTLLLSSCVTMRKYDDMVASRDHYQREFERLKPLEKEKADLLVEKKDLTSQLRQCTNELEESRVRMNSLDKSYQDLLGRYEILLDQNKALLNASSTEIQTLTEQLAEQRDQLDRRSRSLDSLQQTLQEKQADLAEWQKKVTDLQAALNSQDEQVNALRERINEALLGFTAADLTVSEKNGKLYVSLSQNLLFRTGSDQLDPKGKEAISQLSAVLINNPDIQITVEGHTDNVGSAATNWDLSVSRATSVIKELARNGVDQDRITAAGRAYFFPLAPNDSPENKARNRRVEIILSPKLEALYELVR